MNPIPARGVVSYTSWVDGAVNAKVHEEATTSWWTEPGTRAQFDEAALANLRRMSMSKFGRASRVFDRGFGEGE